ncbi:unnamed protein product [Microthlaspi erraticum]|nr:unnamed protein product [Microthlaspi erraticum]
MLGSQDSTVEQKPKISEISRSMRQPGLNNGTSISELSSPPAQTFIRVKEEPKCYKYKEVIDLECGVQPEPAGCCEVSSVTNCDEDPETSFVRGTSCMIKGCSAASSCSCSKNESSSSATGFRSLRSPDQFLKQHRSTASFRKTPLGAESSVTPERHSIGDLTPEAESSYKKSVNSHALKRRKFISSPVIIDLEEEDNSNDPSTRPADHTSFTRRIEFGFGGNEPRSQNYNVSCSICRSPLGHPESHSYISCSLTSSSKTYLMSLLKETSGSGSSEMPTSVSVVMTDSSLVNQRLCRSSEGSKAIWCDEDGCVFNSIFCPFCNIPNTCLGVQVMATDSSNVQFMRKTLFFADQVDVTEVDASKETALKHKLRLPKQEDPEN